MKKKTIGCVLRGTDEDSNFFQEFQGGRAFRITISGPVAGTN